MNTFFVVDDIQFQSLGEIIFLYFYGIFLYLRVYSTTMTLAYEC